MAIVYALSGQLEQEYPKSRIYKKIIRRTIILFGLMLLYWALMEWVPVPGVGAESYAKGANIANYLDGILCGITRCVIPGKSHDLLLHLNGYMMFRIQPNMAHVVTFTFHGFNLITTRRILK